MRLVCYICREERDVKELMRDERHILVVCDRGHKQFVPRDVIYG